MKLPDPLKIIVIKRLAQETTELIFRVKNDIIMITYKISFQKGSWAGPAAPVSAGNTVNSNMNIFWEKVVKEHNLYI